MTSRIIHSGPVAGFDEDLDQFQALDDLLALGLGLGLGEIDAQVLALDVGRSICASISRTASAPMPTAEKASSPYSSCGADEQLLLGEQLARLQFGVRPGSITTIAFEVENPLELAQGSCRAGCRCGSARLQEPDMGDRRGQLDMAHALAPDLGLVTSTPHFSQTTPRYFMRLYLPHRHS